MMLVTAVLPDRSYVYNEPFGTFEEANIVAIVLRNIN
jgi:hypothetical protein